MATVLTLVGTMIGLREFPKLGRVISVVMLRCGVSNDRGVSEGGLLVPCSALAGWS